jgi:hypothetical protein
MNASPICLRLDWQLAWRPFSLARANTGKRMAASRAIRAMTINNYKRVKPLLKVNLCDIVFSPEFEIELNGHFWDFKYSEPEQKKMRRLCEEAGARGVERAMPLNENVRMLFRSTTPATDTTYTYTSLCRVRSDCGLSEKRSSFLYFYPTKNLRPILKSWVCHDRSASLPQAEISIRMFNPYFYLLQCIIG